jgi:putative sigma-54 modulation protein
VENKLDPVVRHFDKVTGVNVVLSVEKLKQKAEVTVHVPGKDMHVEESGDDLYAAIDDVRQAGPSGSEIQAKGPGSPPW